ncbi:cobalamin biosynthesis protein CobW [Swaminathania salitolerans]|uniref:Cobalamin biosynthesis protein CobW n=1 Tax=Swaminathania salitolerans TaxID=182838 RepID=A0A511BRC2_9PROT|nr:cobalamin biosynthesis protein CobW [Swaminathania salitolerans]GBQ14025.1 cobalamin synthesis protein CobW [Swaminathania salitolerans LMG 21291]GEL02887.1 cobalamin biosynthesis protein CobW [Swaminathania salitolerans]
MSKIPVTIITGFLGAGKTTLLRHLLERSAGRRIAIVVNEFGSLGIDGETLRGCAIPNCPEEDIVELTNGCLCCTVADDFIPTMEALLDRSDPPEHIVIETSGLALPKPLLKAFGWPGIRTRMTVDGVITVVDAPAVAEGRFADDPEAVARQREADDALDHDNPLEEVYEDQLDSADLVILNKTDLLDEAALSAVETALARRPRRVRTIRASEGRVDPAVLLGLSAAAEDDLAARPSHHDGAGDHEHDDFASFVMELPEQESTEAFLSRLDRVVRDHDVLRMKGYVPVAGKALRLGVQAVGGRMRHAFESGPRGESGRLVVIGLRGLDPLLVQRSFGSV